MHSQAYHPATLLDLRAPDKQIPIPERGLLLGRSAQADYLVLHPLVSRFHALFRPTDQGYVIADLDSTNGTFVNHLRLRGQEVVLNHRDIITLAHFTVHEGWPHPPATMIFCHPGIVTRQALPSSIRILHHHHPRPLLPRLAAAALIVATCAPGCQHARSHHDLPSHRDFISVQTSQRHTGSQFSYVYCGDEGHPCSAPSPKTPITFASVSSLPRHRSEPRQPASPLLAASPAAAAHPLAPHRKMNPIQRTLTFEFAVDSHTLDGQQTVALTRTLAEFASIDQLDVTGYTDAVGPKDHNDRLALARARAVHQTILATSISVATANVRGEGLCCYLTSNADSEGRRRNRRVEVQLMGAPTPTPQEYVL